LTDRSAEQAFNSVIEKDTDELMGLTFQCVCGKTHSIPIDYLSVNKGAVNEIRNRMDESGISGAGVLIYDRKIESRVVERVSKTMKEQGITFTLYPVGDGKKDPRPEIDLSKSIAEDIGEKADFLMSVGSGVISDLTKYASAVLKIPCILVPTAPSMNGYTSSMAALTDRGIKKTLMIPPAKAIFADIDILVESPIEMVRSGLGDIVSKSVCNADWKLSQLIKDTYFCPLPSHITDKTEPLYLAAAGEIGERTGHGMEVLTDGIMRSGLSMTVIGTSTPSSGAEHVIAHYWDLMALKDGGEKHFHGVQVGVATLVMLKLFDFIRSFPVKKVDINKLKRNCQSKSEFTAFIEKKFGIYAEGVREEYFSKYMNWREKEQEIGFIIENWTRLWDELDTYIRPIEPVEDALKRCGAAVYYHQLGKSREEMLDALKNAPYIRGRYTLLDLAMDLGILEEAAEKIIV